MLLKNLLKVQCHLYIIKMIFIFALYLCHRIVKSWRFYKEKSLFSTCCLKKYRLRPHQVLAKANKDKLQRLFHSYSCFFKWKMSVFREQTQKLKINNCGFMWHILNQSSKGFSQHLWSMVCTREVSSSQQRWRSAVVHSGINTRTTFYYLHKKKNSSRTENEKQKGI